MPTRGETTSQRPTGVVVDRDVIHDIGYQHYAGPRLGRGYLRASLFTESLRGSYGLGRSARSKVMPLLLLAAICLPALIIGIVTAVMGAEELPLAYPAYLFNVQVVAAIYLAAQAPALMSRDLRFRVISLYFSRPMERIDYVCAKYAAMVSAVFLLLALPTTILFLGALLAKLPVGEQLPDYLRGLATCILYAVALSGIGLLIAAMTPRRGFGVAAVISVLLILSGIQLAVLSITGEFGQLQLAGYSGLISPFSLVDGVSHAVLGSESNLPSVREGVDSGPPGTLGAIVFTGVFLLLAVGSFAALLARYRRVAAS